MYKTKRSANNNNLSQEQKLAIDVNDFFAGENLKLLERSDKSMEYLKSALRFIRIHRNPNDLTTFTIDF